MAVSLGRYVEVRAGGDEQKKRLDGRKISRSPAGRALSERSCA